jgi:SAM-dependent methyltransferase
VTLLSCTTPLYDQLYARWLGYADEPLCWGQWLPHMALLDLCGGTGAVSKAALKEGGRDITLFDLRPRCGLHGVVEVRGDVNRGDLRVQPWHRRFDFIVCRQSLAYLNLRELTESIPDMLRPGGRFVVNTFRQPRWKLDLYRHEGEPFAEASAYFGKQVFHLQAGRAGVDVTAFRWHRLEDILKALVPWLVLERCRFTAKSIWLAFGRPQELP